MMELAAHPMWSDNPEDLATAIYYTVLAKSGDKRGWKWESPTFEAMGASWRVSTMRANRE